ncbi:MAG: hypothetical protein GEV06_04125 [Luteitalea sp.]|nr:hypothetical protein [Luteitalea sp.]
MARHPLPAFMLLALLHGVTMVLVRPMFQVSDELTYFAGAQEAAVRLVARQPGDPDRARLLHHDLFVYDAPAGKPLFRYAGGAAYIALSHIVRLPDGALLLRLFYVLSLPVAVLATWLLASRLAPGNRTVLLCAPLFVALHPVFVKYSAAVTPDAWANAAAMFAVWLAVRIADGTARGIEPLVALLVSAVAIALKDTSFFLAALVPCSFLLRLRIGVQTTHGDLLAWIRSDPWLVALPVSVSVVLVVSLLTSTVSSVLASPYEMNLNGALSLSRIPALGLEMVATTWQQIPSLFDSFWGNLGNFGATIVPIPAAVMRVILVATLLAGVGLLLAAWRRPSSTDEALESRAGVTLLLIGGALLLLLQPAVRQVLLDADDLFQGRWLFPMMGAIAVALTAGWSALWPQPDRLSPLIGWLLATYAVTAMVVVVIPYYYVNFPETYRLAGIFVQGTAGKGADPARVLPYLARPSLLSGNALMVGVLGLWLAWLAVCLVRLPRWAHGYRARTGH